MYDITRSRLNLKKLEIPFAYHFGENLTALRLYHGLKRKDVIVPTISNYETGSFPCLENLVRLSRLYTVDVDDLLGIEPLRAGLSEAQIKNSVLNYEAANRAVCLSVSGRLYRIRKYYGLEPEVTAVLCGIGKTAYENFEQGNTTPKLLNLLKIAHFYSMPAGYFLGVDEAD